MQPAMHFRPYIDSPNSYVGLLSFISVQFKFFFFSFNGYLASDGVVGRDPGVPVRDEIEVDDLQQAVVKDLRQVIHYEIGAVWAQGLVV